MKNAWDPPDCPRCDEPVDIRPALRQFGYRNILPKGQGVRCRNCSVVLEINQWHVLAAAFVPFLVFFLPLLWLPTPPVQVRFLIAMFGVGPVLVLLLFPPTRLYRLQKPDPSADIRPDDELMR